VVYKAGKTNVNADALSRNPVNFGEAACNIIKPNKRLNPDDSKDAEIISEMLEESDEDEEDENFELYVSDDEKIDETTNDDLPDENLDSIPFTQEELCEPPKLQIIEKALIHDLPKCDRIQTRSQTRNKKFHQSLQNI